MSETLKYTLSILNWINQILVFVWDIKVYLEYIELNKSNINVWDIKIYLEYIELNKSNISVCMRH